MEEAAPNDCLSDACVQERVTVVLLTHNRSAEVMRTVQRLRGLADCPHLIVVDNASTDDTAACLRGLQPPVEVITLDHNAGGAGRNEGIKAARTPYVALCDDDTWWAPGSLGNAVRRLDAEPNLAVVCGLMLVGDTERIDDICVAMSRTPLGPGDELEGYPVLGFLAGGSVVRRAAMMEIGGFNEHYFVGGEEELVALDLAARGWRLRYLPEVVVHHHPSAIRDHAGRRRILLRNSMWTAVLRYPWRLLIRHCAQQFTRARRQRLSTQLMVDTVQAIPWLLKNRRELPPDVVHQVEILRTQAISGEVEDAVA